MTTSHYILLGFMAAGFIALLANLVYWFVLDSKLFNAMDKMRRESWMNVYLLRELDRRKFNQVLWIIASTVFIVALAIVYLAIS